MKIFADELGALLQNHRKAIIARRQKLQMIESAGKVLDKVRERNTNLVTGG
jgi:hypothetical protein